MPEGCVFCKIVNKEIPAGIVYEDDLLVAFHDISPQVPAHILIVPKEHIPSVNDVTEEHLHVLGRIPLLARDLAKQIGVAEDGWRLVINSGQDAKQTVFHLHVHLLGGRPMTGQMA